MVARNKQIFNKVESAGNEITYRCIKCRDYQGCKNGERIEMISTKEEVEQAIIIKSVTVDLETNTTSAFLPFVVDLFQNLVCRRDKSMKVYRSQVQILNKDPRNKDEVISSQNKLQSLGFADFVWNLTPEQQQRIRMAPLRYYIPWRAVWNSNSLSTPCRLVFDASMPTASGKSLNDVVAKGCNQMNKLVEIVIRWFMRRIAFHTDVRKMYNSVKLNESDWVYQLYLWEKNLDPHKEPVDKAIKTAIYGVKPSGNQAEHGLCQTAQLQKEEYP